MSFVGDDTGNFLQFRNSLAIAEGLIHNTYVDDNRLQATRLQATRLQATRLQEDRMKFRPTLMDLEVRTVPTVDPTGYDPNAVPVESGSPPTSPADTSLDVKIPRPLEPLLPPPTQAELKEQLKRLTEKEEEIAAKVKVLQEELADIVGQIVGLENQIGKLAEAIEADKKAGKDVAAKQAILEGFKKSLEEKTVKS